MNRCCAIVLVGALVILCGPNAHAQYEAKARYAGPHVGFPGVGTGVAIGGTFEQAISRDIGVGAFLDYWTFDENFGVSGYSARYTAIGAMASYHFSVSNTKIDPFAGLSLGYYLVGVDVDEYMGVDVCSQADCDESRLFLGAQAGLRYFLTPKAAVVARGGFGASYLTLGVDWKF